MLVLLAFMYLVYVMGTATYTHKNKTFTNITNKTSLLKLN